MPSSVSQFGLFNPEDVYIIAEGGVNHNGDVSLASRMIDAAKATGANAIKFQTWITDRVYSRRDSIKPEYQKRGTDPGESEYDTLKKLELSFAAFRELKVHADEVGIEFLSTPDERESADFLIDELHVPLVKVASQDITNLPFLAYLGQRHVPVILSTGTATLAEVARAADTLQASGCKDLALLHCVSCYPAPIEAANLRAILTLREALHLPVGYSDHTPGVETACAAVALGACILEKHFTLSTDLPGPDQQASMDPSGFKKYVEGVRTIHKALGDGIKRPAPEEMPNRLAMRRFLVAARELPAGHQITEGDVLFKKVTYGLGPAFFNLVAGSVTRRTIQADERFSLDALLFPPQAGFE